ncbi:MAG: OsmC family protein [Bacteroidota bacterium]
MATDHHFTIKTEWTGNRGSGTLDYRAYSRSHSISAVGKSAPIEGSSDPKFRGDPTRYNPEELFISSLSACHMLWYLHLAAVNGITVLEYVDHAEGIMQEASDGVGRFTEVTLKPKITIAQEDKLTTAHELHHEAGKKCFIANSVNCQMAYVPEITIG